MKKYIKITLLCMVAGLTFGCADYLDIVPDNVATMEHAFSNRAAAERFLFGCYNYLPNADLMRANPAWYGGDEYFPCFTLANEDITVNFAIGRGYQNANDPYLNYWDGQRNAKNLFIGIRDCNIFLENIHIPLDMLENERKQWMAEAKVVKAYLHAYLMELYGPIPIIRENLPVGASSDKVRVFREPVDEVVDYIVELLDEAMPDLLPEAFTTEFTDAGRITRPIAAAIKAKVLTLAASPLFNGNPDYANFKDKRGIQLISSDPSDASVARKWERAATAIREAIDMCHAGGHALYRYAGTSGAAMSDTTRMKYTLRGAVCDKFNPEIIWPYTGNNLETTQRILCANLGPLAVVTPISEAGPTLKVAEQYYSRNGIPISEDMEWIQWLGGDLTARYDPVRVSTAPGNAAADHTYYIRSSGASDYTAKLHFYREPRFYAHLGFDRGVWEGQGRTEANSHVVEGRAAESQGFTGRIRYVPCGYFAKKMIHLETRKEGATFEIRRYALPLIRLADLYLLYAEALNETKSAPDAEVYQWVDIIRARAGLKGVVESWQKSTNPAKPASKEGMREIIKQERMIELALEAQRFWDLRRWKDALRAFSQPMQGWAYDGETWETYYRVTTYLQRTFTARDYLWPLKLSTLQVNSNLVQNPGW